MAIHNCNSLLASSFYDTNSKLQLGTRLHSSFHGSLHVFSSVGQLTTLTGVRLCKDAREGNMGRWLWVLWGPKPRMIVVSKTSRSRLYSVSCKDDLKNDELQRIWKEAAVSSRGTTHKLIWKG
jgi:hypothetical protein